MTSAAAAPWATHVNGAAAASRTGNPKQRSTSSRNPWSARTSEQHHTLCQHIPGGLRGQLIRPPQRFDDRLRDRAQHLDHLVDLDLPSWTPVARTLPCTTTNVLSVPARLFPSSAVNIPDQQLVHRPQMVIHRLVSHHRRPGTTAPPASRHNSNTETSKVPPPHRPPMCARRFHRIHPAAQGLLRSTPPLSRPPTPTGKDPPRRRPPAERAAPMLTPTGTPITARTRSPTAPWAATRRPDAQSTASHLQIGDHRHARSHHPHASRRTTDQRARLMPDRDRFRRAASPSDQHSNTEGIIEHHPGPPVASPPQTTVFRRTQIVPNSPRDHDPNHPHHALTPPPGLQ